MRTRVALALLLTLAIGVLLIPSAPAASKGPMIGVNVLLRTDPTSSVLTRLSTYGKVRDVVAQIDAVTMQIPSGNLSALRSLSVVASAEPDAEVMGRPVAATSFDDFTAGINTWDLDAIDVTDLGRRRVTGYDGTGTYVAVLDTGLLSSWPAYFPASRIATEYALALGGGGGEVGWVSTQPNKWQSDQNSHGTHVTSTILGYDLFGTAVNGVAPGAKVIPVKVLNNSGSGWGSTVARGIVYVADLKAGLLRGHPVVINMSLGASEPSPIEIAAIDYAISKGVLVVASAGNEGDAGMGYPGAYAPVISVAASGWTGEWMPDRTWWYAQDVPDPTSAEDFYITDFSGRAKPGQDLDVAAPGSWVVGPYQVNGQLSYYSLGGTSMASPHVAGIVALMAQKVPTLTQARAESILEGSAIALPPGCRTVFDILVGGEVEFCWGADATGSGLANAARALAATR